jgi:hypothetical protein
MKSICIPFLLFLPFFSFSQRVHVNFFGGFSSYQGDLQDKSFDPKQTFAVFGAGVKYDLTRHFSLRSGLSLGKAGASDKLNVSSLQPRNLSFQSKILEVNLLAEYTFFDLQRHKFSPYIFGGVGLYHFNPYAYDSLGNQVYLKPLSTEGQGLAQYPGRKPYHLRQFNVPVGAGLKMRISNNMVLAYEIGFRKLFTDYLDDVSTTFIDGTTLAAARGSKALEMAYRGGELKTGDPLYPPDGTIRGGPNKKDSYLFQGITLSIALKSVRNPRLRSGELICPPSLNGDFKGF